MRASIITRLERLEKDSPANDEAKRIDKIILFSMDGSIEHVLWMRGAANG